MYKKYLNLYNILIIGLATQATGILTLTLSKKFLFVLVYLLSLILLLNAISSIIKLTTKKITIKSNGILLQISLNIIMATIFIFIPNIPFSLVSLIFGLYIIFNSVVKFINYLIFKTNKTHGRFLELFICLFYLFFGLSCILSPLVSVNTVLLIIGIYLIMLGSTYILDFITQIIPTKQKNKFRKKVKITLPMFLSVLVPRAVLTQINNGSNNIIKEKSNEEADLEIFIHVTKEGYGQMGHCDFYFDGCIHSYGNYDYNSSKFFQGFGDGVFFTTEEKEKYLKFCIKDSNKTIFGFGLKLTENQKKKIRKQLEKIKENTYKWNYPIKEAKKKHKKKPFYAIRLSKTIKVNFYKFKTGKFKTFFVLNTNCVRLVDYILGNSCLDSIKINGIITPGSYYDFLATEYMKKNSNVISYTIYK